jgi:signal transduction histidine kinase
MPVVLHDLAAACIAELAQSAADKNIALALDGADKAQILGDPTLLAVLLRNLVDNAIRYSSAADEVEVSVTRAPGALVLRVADNGPGIAQEERDRVLDRFYRIVGSSGQGSGLGLSIVKRIADLHHASIRLLSKAQGTGLVVEVSFPWEAG